MAPRCLKSLAVLAQLVVSVDGFACAGPVCRAPISHARTPPIRLPRTGHAVTFRAGPTKCSAEMEVSKPVEVDESLPVPVAEGPVEKVLHTLHELEEQGAASIVLIMMTFISLGLANSPLGPAWLGMWASHIGPSVAGHALSMRAWVNEGLMAIFFFTVGLEIKHELRLGSLASVKKALLPCIAAVGGMVTPMAVYLLIQKALPGGSLAALAVPMATDIAFAMSIFGFFKSKMPAASSAFLLTLATVDDLGAILVLAVCFATNVCLPFLGGAVALSALLSFIGNKKSTSTPVFAAGGVGLWWLLLRAGVSADIAGVAAALTVSTKAVMPGSDGELYTDHLLKYLAPFSTFFIMPVFALANMAIALGGATPSAVAASMTPALGIAGGLVIGKPLGIFAFSWLAVKMGLSSMPTGMTKRHVGIVGLLGGIGFTMCLLLTEVSISGPMQIVPKLAVLGASAAAAVGSAVFMSMLPSQKKTA